MDTLLKLKQFLENLVKFGDCVEDEDIIRDAIREIEELRDLKLEYEVLFNQRWSASMRAIKLWQKAHPGNERVWPDATDLCSWLIEENERIMKRGERSMDNMHLFAEEIDLRGMLKGRQ